jgi:hypothetical protein
MSLNRSIIAVREAGSRHDFGLQCAPPYREVRALGWIDGAAVALQSDGIATTVRVQTEFPGLSVERTKAASGPVEEDGRSFFQRFQLRATDEADILSRLNPESRGLIELIIGPGRATLQDGVLRCRRPLTTSEDLQAAAEALVELARGLADQPGSTPQRLLRRACPDAEPSVEIRSHCLEALLSGFPKSPEAREGLQLGLRDDAPAVRFHAARAMGEAGRPILRQLLRDPRLPDHMRSSARALFGDHDGGELAMVEELGGDLAVVPEERRGRLSKTAV